MGQWSDFYFERLLSPAEISTAVGAMFGVDTGAIEILDLDDISTMNDRRRPIFGIMTRYEPDFPLRLQIAVADDLAAAWNEITFAQALSKILDVRILLDDPALPSTPNAFLLLEPAGISRRVLSDMDALDDEPSRIQLPDRLG